MDYETSGQGGRKLAQDEGHDDTGGIFGIRQAPEERKEVKHSNSGIAEILEKKAQKKLEQAIKKIEEPQPRQPLLLDRNSTGLYYVRYERGTIPNLLKGHFTHKSRIYALAKEAGIEEIKEVHAGSNSR